ncbi:MAG: type II toxin-antitoxin system RelE/ParE family toxin [Dehalococcoidia bacterium]
MAYRVELTPSARRGLRQLPRQVQVRLEVPILALCEEPRPSGVRKLVGQERTWRIRIGPYRIVYDLDGDLVLVVVVGVSRRNEGMYRR